MTTQESFIIEAKNLGYQVGKQKLLNDIQLQIKKGEHWLIYGMNGCGKTTLLSILAGYRQQTQGELRVLGDPFSNQNVLEKRKQIGWVSSSFFDVRYHHERVKDIVLSGKSGTYGISWELTDDDYNRANALLTALGLENKQQMSYDRLSKGQRQNVLIARAFMNCPQILLLDEPCSGLDVLAKSHFMELLQTLMQQENLTVLFVSHEINEIQSLFPNTVMLRNGRIFAQGKTDTLFQPEKLSAFFRQKINIETVIETRIQPVSVPGKQTTELFIENSR